MSGVILAQHCVPDTRAVYGNEYQKYITCNINDSFAILPVNDNDSLEKSALRELGI